MNEKVLERPCCLIVEDQTLIAISIETFLEQVGIAVQAVGSVGHARAWLETNTADIAIVASLSMTDLPRSLLRYSTDAAFRS